MESVDQGHNPPARGGEGREREWLVSLLAGGEGFDEGGHDDTNGCSHDAPRRRIGGGRRREQRAADQRVSANREAHPDTIDHTMASTGLIEYRVAGDRGQGGELGRGSDCLPGERPRVRGP